MDGLTHPRDLEAWDRWHHGHQPLARRLRRTVSVLRDIARPDGRAGEVVVTRGGPTTRLVVLLESRSPTSVLALLAPLRDLASLEGVVVVSPVPVRDLLPPWVWQESRFLSHDAVPRLVREGEVALSTGHFLPLGRLGREAVADPERFVTVQHGLMTPHSPPLAEGTTLLAWTDADGAFWRSGRDDVRTTVVGSQLLWDAAAPPPATVDPDARPVFLGQLHGSELPTAQLAGAAESFCRAEGAAYRPHPVETDRRSRATHARWEAEGISIDRSRTPLRELGAPVVSVFSTGVLEAAAAGLPAWVHCPDPPAWLEEFWDRYGLARWGGPATPSPERPRKEPSHTVASVLQGMMTR
ncbi:RNA-binding protein [Oryzobacter telluris]|uniref:RNA-binding protein n=1 Tax=Oryzobacter telluris TaxID=3149179 RepID=UPI00370D753C